MGFGNLQQNSTYLFRFINFNRIPSADSDDKTSDSNSSDLPRLDSDERASPAVDSEQKIPSEEEVIALSDDAQSPSERENPSTPNLNLDAINDAQISINQSSESPMTSSATSHGG